MATRSTELSGQQRLSRDLEQNTIAPLYVFYGEETYLKEQYLGALRKRVVGDGFADFNDVILDGKALTPEQLQEAIDSVPVMSEKKLVVVNDFSLYSPPAGWSEVLVTLLDDLPDYLCLVFYYDTLECKQDKRLKIHKCLQRAAVFAEFTRLGERDLVSFVQQQAQGHRVRIAREDAAHLVFVCGSDMNRLCSEVAKAASFTTTGQIARAHIDAVCSPTTEAVVFDLTDAVAAGQFARAVAIVTELLVQKNQEIAVFSAITRHMQRLYAAKLCEQSGAGENAWMELVGSRSRYYIGKLKSAARIVPLSWLRQCAGICAQTDDALKRSAADKQKQIELALLAMAVSREEAR